MPKLNQADFESLKNRTGLVPMVMKHPQAPYRAGQIAGLTPDIAYKQYIDGDAYPHGVRLDPDDRAEVPTRILKPTAPGVSTRKLVEIPKDILLKKQGFSMRRLSLAARISGKPAKTIEGDEAAIAIIKEEMEARGIKVEEPAAAAPAKPAKVAATAPAAAQTPPPPAPGDRIIPAAADDDEE